MEIIIEDTVQSDAVKEGCDAEFRAFFNHTSALPKLLGDETYADFIIRCGEKDFKVHKCIVCARSPVFANVFKHGTREGKTNIVVHEEFDAEAIQRMISYMYGVPYTVSGISRNLDTVEHIRAYFAGEYYDLPGLKLAALVWFDEFCRLPVEVEGFVDVLSEVYKRIDIELTTKIFKLAMENADRLVQSEEFMAGVLEREELSDFTVHFLKANVEIRCMMEKEYKELDETTKEKIQYLEMMEGIQAGENKLLRAKYAPGAPTEAPICGNDECPSFGRFLWVSVNDPGKLGLLNFRCKGCGDRWRAQ